MIKTILTILIFLFCLLSVNAQDTLFSQLDTLPKKELKPTKTKKRKSLKQFFKEGYPSPKKAVILAIVPGMGQIYNKKYWKLPLVYGALGGVIYAINYNTTNYDQAVLSLSIKDGSMIGIDPFPDTPPTAVQAARNSFDKNRQLSWIGLIGFYLISAGDALVDAHLRDFSVDDDISLVPILETDYNNHPVFGLGCRINLSK